MKQKRAISIVLSMLVLLIPMQISQAGWDSIPAHVPVGTSSELVDIELTGFKGSRIEYVDIPLEEPIEPGKYDYVMSVDMKNMWASERAVYVKPVAYDESATFTVNGQACDFNVPYRLELGSVPYNGTPVEIPCVIEVTSGDGSNKSTYTLKFVNQDLYDRVKVAVIEETIENGKYISGVYQFTSIDGFTSAEDCAIFIGRDRAILFDALNGGGNGSRRGGDLKNIVYGILTEKFGVADPDNFPIDVAITHNNPDHIGLINSSTALQYRFDERGPGNGTIYWMIGSGTALSDSWHTNPNTDVKMAVPGDVITGPDFGNGPLEFEVITVRTHEVGHLLYLYDNDAGGGQCRHSYLMPGDAIGSGSYVFNHNNSNCIMPLFNRDMEKLWDRVKGLSDLHILSGHKWQERTLGSAETGKQYVEDMYVASSIVLDDPFAGEFATTSASSYYRQLSYGTAGLWYNDAAAYDYRDGQLTRDKVTPAHLLNLYLLDEIPIRNRVASYTALSTAQTYTAANANPLFLFAEAFGENASIAVSLNGANVPLGFDGERGDRGYRLDILASDDPALAAANGINVAKIDVGDAASGASMTYSIYIRTINNNTLYPLPNISAEAYSFSSRPATNISGQATLNEVYISSFKGGRLEPYLIPLDTPIVPTGEAFNIDMLRVRDLSATVDWSDRTSNAVYILAEPTDPSIASYTINGAACRYPVPYKAELAAGANIFTIIVGSGASATSYTLTINAAPLWDKYAKDEIEPGVWRIQDADGFVTNEDMYLFVGEDKAMLFDTGMGEGDLRACVDGIVGDPNLPVEVVLTHAHGDHIGKLDQFAGCKVYWPRNEALPASLDADGFVYVDDGDIITGPKFGGGAIAFECVEVPGHTDGSMCYLYDNKAQRALESSYLVSGDAVGSGSYVFMFGATKPTLAAYLDGLRKLEAKIAPFADGFYDPAQKVRYKDVDGLRFLSGHSWQETTNKRAMYSVMWNAPLPLRRLAGIQMVRDMRIATEKAVSGEWRGRLFTRNAGGVVEELRQLAYREAGLWYNGWLVVPIATAGITAPEALDTDFGKPLNYGVTLANVSGTNRIEITAKFDCAKLDYAGSSINIPASLGAQFYEGPSYDAATGIYKATIRLLQQGALFAASDPTEILSINFVTKGNVPNGDSITGGLISARVSEILSPVEAADVNAWLDPPDATTSISNHWRFDINGDGRIDVLDIDLVIYNYYLARAGDANWGQAMRFDANGDGIIDLADILIICSYF